MVENWTDLHSQVTPSHSREFALQNPHRGGPVNTGPSLGSRGSVEGRTKFAERQFTLACPVCGKMFKQNIDLKRHSRRHTGEKPFPCPLCPYRATVKCALQRHMLTHSGDQAASGYENLEMPEDDSEPPSQLPTDKF